MDSHDVDVVTPRLRSEDADMNCLPWVNPDDFNPGYMNRSVHLFSNKEVVIPGEMGSRTKLEKRLFP